MPERSHFWDLVVGEGGPKLHSSNWSLVRGVLDQCKQEDDWSLVVVVVGGIADKLIVGCCVLGLGWAGFKRTKESWLVGSSQFVGSQASLEQAGLELTS